MSITTSDSRSPSVESDDSIKASLTLLQNLLDEAPDRMFESAFFEQLHKEFMRLHARIRIHHAVAVVNAEDGELGVPPEWTEEMARLQAEHSVIIGQLDRLIRVSESMADQTLEDKDVFILRGRELIALLRRHEAEEDRLFYLSVWRDTGGES